MDEYDFVVSGPVLIVADRRPGMEHGYLNSAQEGREFLVVFTDRDASYRYYEGIGKPAWMIFRSLDTIPELIKFLETAEKGGCENIGFNPTPDNVPQKMLPLKRVLESARRHCWANDLALLPLR
jgi:hypothetical protein